MLVKPLSQLDSGSRGEVLAIAGRSKHSQRLRRMGIREGVVVEVMSNHDPVMLKFDGCCMAVGREMLDAVTICRCGCEKEDAAAQAAGVRGSARRDQYA